MDKLVPTEGGEVLYIKISFPGYLKKEEIKKLIAKLFE